MKPIRKIFSEWIKDLNIRIYSTSWRKLVENDFHVRKLSAKEFIRLLKTAEFTFDNRNIFNKKLISFSHKNKIKEEYITKLLELRKDDYVKFKIDKKIQIGRYQGEINNGKELVEIEVNGNRALNYFYIEKRKVLFPTRKEISKVLKKEIESRTQRELTPLTDNYFTNNISYLSYYD
ncbi:MAG: hypothetical protein Q7S39_11235 [Ignavibacteria bacterium]|nr:hypothetical protein [Ignavibacteria bacterium]